METPQMKHEKAIAALEAASRIHQKSSGAAPSHTHYVVQTASDLLKWLKENG